MVTFLTTIQMMLFLIFIISALTKFRDMRGFVQLVNEYDILPPPFSTIYGYMAPFLELTAALMLLFQTTFSIGAGLTFALLVNFGCAVFTVLLRKQVISCGCYGNWLNSDADGFTLAKIVVLILFNLCLLFFPQPHYYHLTTGSITLAITATIIIFVMQMIWNNFRQNMNLL